MKAVVYSFDAYISVVIALIGIGLLLAYSSLNSNYADYYQAKILTLDGLRVLIDEGALLTQDQSKIAPTLDFIIPTQYNYRLRGEGISPVERGDVDSYKKFKVSSSILVPVSSHYSVPDNPYSYKTCNGGSNSCSLIGERDITPENLVEYKEYSLEVSI